MRSSKWKSILAKGGRIIGVLVVIASLAYYGVWLYSKLMIDLPSIEKELDIAESQLALMQQEFEAIKQESTPDISVHSAWSHSLDFSDLRDMRLGFVPRDDIPFHTRTWKDTTKLNLPKTTRYVWLQIQNHGGTATLTGLQAPLGYLWQGTRFELDQLPQQDRVLKNRARRFLFLGWFDVSATKEHERSYIEKSLLFDGGVVCTYTDIFSKEHSKEIPGIEVYMR